MHRASYSATTLSENKSPMKTYGFAIAALGMTAVVTGSQPNNHAADRPNVLLITVDDLNDWVGCLGGHPQAKTPKLPITAAVNRSRL